MGDLNGISMRIGPSTKFIISTSGRISSLSRYNRLLQDILMLDIAYIPISSNDLNNLSILPQNFANVLRGLNCIGGAISKDIKNSIIPYLDELDDISIKTQSVNTVILKDGKLIGHNTDALGFKLAISNTINNSIIKIESAICYGYGGVTSVVVHVLKSFGIKTFIVGRRLDEARKRATELSAEVWTIENCPPGSAPLFINATPISDIPLTDSFISYLQGCTCVFDHNMPGRHLRTYCADNNIAYIDGYSMYYPQMYAQWKLFLRDYVDDELIPGFIKQAENVDLSR